MQGKATFLGQAIHLMLVAFPLGLLGASVAFDWLGLGLTNAQLSLVAFYLISGGLISGVIATTFGLIDWMAVPQGTRARRLGAVHAAGNLLVLLLFAASWTLREPSPASPPSLALALSWGGAMSSLITAWLGGHLLDLLGMDKRERAPSDATTTSSLSNRTA